MPSEDDGKERRLLEANERIKRAQAEAAKQREAGEPRRPPVREALRGISIPSDEDLEHTRKQMEEEEGRALKAKADRAWRDAGFPDRHAGKVDWFLGETDMDHPEWKAKLGLVLQVVAKGGIVGLIGLWGVGKTQLGACVGRKVCLEGGTVRYFKAHRLFVELRGAFNKTDVDEASILDRLTGYNLLVIDDAHQRGHTDYEDRMLHHILDCRYDRERPTILISNEEPEVFCESIGSAVVDRMEEAGALLKCDWGSFRRGIGT